MIKFFWCLAACLTLSTPPTRASGLFSPQINRGLNYLGHGLNVDAIEPGSPTAYPEANLRRMRAMGLTYVRIPVSVDQIVVGAPHNLSGVATPAEVAAALTKLDGLVALFLKNGFAVTLCMFPTPGVQALPAPLADPIYLAGDTAIAARYGHVDANRIFLEVMNEPHMDVNSWNALAPPLAAAARAAAPANTLIVDAAWNAIPTNLPFLVPLADPNVIYDMHVYQPALLSTQGSQAPVDRDYLFPRPAGETGPPGSLIATEWTARKLAAYVFTGIGWARRQRLPLIMNEFGVSSLCDPRSEINWLSFMRQIADDNSVPWAFWGYHHLFPTALAGQAPNYDPVVFKALGPTPYQINFGINMTGSAAPYLLTN